MDLEEAYPLKIYFHSKHCINRKANSKMTQNFRQTKIPGKENLMIQKKKHYRLEQWSKLNVYETHQKRPERFLNV